MERVEMIGLIGLGAMGGAMAARLVETGHAVLCHDLLPEARDRATALGATVADTPQAVAGCSLIILSLPKAAHVEAVMTALHPALKPGVTVLDTSTSEPETTRRLAAQAQDAGYAFLDGPVSGGPTGARAGSMTMVVGGGAEALAAIRPILADLTGKLVHVGPSGAGHTAKIANNLLCAANLALVSEMAHLAASAGVSVEELLAGVNAGSGRSAVSEVNFPRWIMTGAYNSGFTMGLMRKDVGMAVALAARMGLDLPATRAIGALWAGSAEALPDSADFNEIYKLGKPDV